MKETIGIKDNFVVVSSLGGTVTEFVWDGDPIIYPEKTIGEKSRGGIPICFPFFSSPPEEFKEIPRHGWLRRQELTIMDVSKDSIKFAGVHNPTSFYPWLLTYFVTVAIVERGLDLKFKVIRFPDGQRSLAPVKPAFHPYFSNLGSHVVMIGDEKITEFPKDSVRVASQEQILIDSGERIMRMKLGGDFNAGSYITLWSDNPEEYFCVEPVLTRPNQFANPDGMFLDENEESEIVFSIELVD